MAVAHGKSISDVTRLPSPAPLQVAIGRAPRASRATEEAGTGAANGG